MKRASCWFIVLWSVWLCHAFNADFCRAVVGMTTTPASRCRTWQNKQRWLPPLVTLTFEYIFACFFFRLSWIRAKPVVSRRLWSYVYHCMQFVLVTTRSVKKYWRVHVVVNEEQLVLGCFDHKGVHHAATELPTSISSCFYCCSSISPSCCPSIAGHPCPGYSWTWMLKKF